MMILKTWLAGFTFLIVCQAQAQDSSVQNLDPVTVTASLQPVAASQTGRNLVVIDGARFKNLPVHSVDELLRYVPGMEVQSRGPMGTQSDFVLRGGTFQQVLVIVDGLRLNDANTGHFNAYVPIAPAEIERIEVLKGAASAIYGSDAVGGVVNIITKTGAAARGMGFLKSWQTSAGIGEWGLVNTNTGGYYRTKNTMLAGGLLTNHAVGQPQRGTRGGFHLNTASLSLSQYLGEHWRLFARTAWDSRGFNAQNYYTTSPADTATEKVKTFWNQLQLKYSAGANALSLQAGYKNVDDNFQFNPSVSANSNKSKLAQALLLYQHNFLKSAYLITGAQFQNRSIASNDRGNHSVKQAAVFALFQKAISEALFVTPALRLDWDERSGTELVPQLNAAYKWNAVNLRGSVGKTIRQPDFTERYNNYNRAFVPSLNRLGNPALDAETSLSWEGGFDYVLSQMLKFSATYFQRNYSNLIDYSATPYSQVPRRQNLSPDGTYFFAQNIASITTRGFEADMVFSKTLQGGGDVFATLGLLTLRSLGGAAAPSLYISSHARFLTNFAVQYATPRFALSTNGLYKQRAPKEATAIKASLTKDYFVLNGKAQFFLHNGKAALFGEVDNIFNRSYSDLLGAQMPQRWTSGGIQISF